MSSWISRRSFIKGLASLVLLSSSWTASFFTGVVNASPSSAPGRALRPKSPYLRPPGALGEKEFLSSCIKCYRCLAVCPYGAIFPAPLSSGRYYGTPVIEPLKTPCYLCMRCPAVCPTGALRVIEKEEARMGHAAIVKGTCLSYHVSICNLCHSNCPLKEKAIRLDDLLRPVIDNDGCAGCGVCLNVCPTEPKSIRLKAYSAHE